MNKKIATQSGIITAFLILTLNVFFVKMKITGNSPVLLLQFLFVLLGFIGSCFALQKHYAGILFFDYLKQCIRTLATIMFIVIAGNVILYLLFRKPEEPWSAMTFMIMKTIFSYSISGAFSAFFTSFLFNTFTKK
ncbi:MAG: hypothetical protein JNM95_15215 [Chitinophagaceae bacterium]|nr:hypothetical protein [Chitinophagaceae bacterium]